MENDEHHVLMDQDRRYVWLMDNILRIYTVLIEESRKENLVDRKNKMSRTVDFLVGSLLFRLIFE
jgi:hypothetical protein